MSVTWFIYLLANALIFTHSSEYDESRPTLEYWTPCLEDELQDFQALAFSSVYSQEVRFMCALLMARFQEAPLWGRSWRCQKGIRKINADLKATQKWLCDCKFPLVKVKDLDWGWKSLKGPVCLERESTSAQEGWCMSISQSNETALWN